MDFRRLQAVNGGDEQIEKMLIQQRELLKAKNSNTAYLANLNLVNFSVCQWMTRHYLRCQ